VAFRNGDNNAKIQRAFSLAFDKNNQREVPAHIKEKSMITMRNRPKDVMSTKTQAMHDLIKKVKVNE